MSLDAASQRGTRRRPADQPVAVESSVHPHRDHLGPWGFDLTRQDHRLAEKVPHEGGGRRLVKASGRADLLGTASIHDRDPVGEAERLDLVVGHEEHGNAEPALEELQLHPHLLAQLGVEVAERLVEQEQIRLVDEGAAERQTLHLPAAQKRRRSALEAAEPHELEHALDPFSHRAAAHAAEPQRVGDVVEHGHVRPDRVGLEDHAEVALVRGHEEPARDRGHDPAAQGDLAGVGIVEACDEAQSRGLAAAARAQQREHLAPPDLERRAIDGLNRPIRLAHAVESKNRVVAHGFVAKASAAPELPARERGPIVRASGVWRDQEVAQVVGPRQATSVRGQDALGAASHRRVR